MLRGLNFLYCMFVRGYMCGHWVGPFPANDSARQLAKFRTPKVGQTHPTGTGSILIFIHRSLKGS